MLTIYEEIIRLQASGEPCALATIVDVKGSSPAPQTSKMLVRSDGSIVGTVGGGCLENDIRMSALDIMDSGGGELKQFELTKERAGVDGLLCGGTISVYIEALHVSRLYLFGAGHISSAVAQLARDCGFYVIVVDDREKYASRNYFPTANEIIVQPFDDKTLAEFRVPLNSYCAILTRGHEHDGECLAWALRQNVRFVGMIGSKTKRETIYQCLREQGFSDADFERVKCPIGLEIGAQSRQEVAVSIVAQLIEQRRRFHDSI